MPLVVPQRRSLAALRREDRGRLPQRAHRRKRAAAAGQEPEARVHVGHS